MKLKRMSLALAIVAVIVLIAGPLACAPAATPAPTKAPASPNTSAPKAAASPAAVQPAPAAAQVIKLKYADLGPALGWAVTRAAQPWLKQIEEATNGRVQVDAYFDQSLVKATDAWDSTKNGVADLAFMFHGYWANKTTLADVISLPMMPFTSAKQASGILWQLYEKYPTLRNQFKENRVLLLWVSEPYLLITSKKQVRTLEDMKGLTLRVPAGPPIDMMKALGANPVTKAMPDVYLALQKGEIDGMAAPWEAILSYRLYEVVKYYTYAPLFTVYFSQAANVNKWDSLPPDVQKQIESVSGLKGSLFWGENMFDSAMAEARNVAKQKGLEMVEYTLPQEEIAKWANVAGKPLWDAWVKKMSDQGHPEAKDILDTTLNLANTYKP